MAGTTVKRTTRSSRSKKKTNLLKLYSVMNKLAGDAVDKEIMKRFKILIETNDEDLTKVQLDAVLKDHTSIDLNSYPEAFLPYVKHYLFMLKRNNRS